MVEMETTVYTLDGAGEMGATTLVLFAHLARTRGPFTIGMDELEKVQETADHYRILLTVNTDGGVTIGVEEREG